MEMVVSERQQRRGWSSRPASPRAGSRRETEGLHGGDGTGADETADDASVGGGDLQ